MAGGSLNCFTFSKFQQDEVAEFYLDSVAGIPEKAYEEGSSGEK